MDLKDSNLILSRKRAKHMRTWSMTLSSTKTPEASEELAVKGIIKRRTKGGFVVDIDGIEAYLPSDLEIKEGTTIQATVIQVDDESDTVTLGYLNDKNEWKCEDECLEKKDNEICGETDHL